MSKPIWWGIVESVIPQRIKDNLDITPAPTFKDSTERRVTQAICTLSLGEKFCVPNKMPPNNLFLQMFKEMSPHAMSSLDYFGDEVIEFTWGKTNYQLLCGGGRCYIKKLVPVERESGFADIVLGLLTFSLGCVEYPQPLTDVDVGRFEDVAEPIKSLVFCKKPGVVAPEEDCFKREPIQDKLSTCVYLTGLCSTDRGACPVYTNDYFTEDGLQFDHDELVARLLAFPDCSDYYDNLDDHSECALFTGDNDWPTGVEKGRHPFVICNDNDLDWLETDMNRDTLVVDESAWTVQAWFRQSPDLCWAVYEVYKTELVWAPQ